MHITSNGPEVKECESLVKKAVKKWHEVKAQSNLLNQSLQVPLPVTAQQFLMLLSKLICCHHWHEMFQNKRMPWEMGLELNIWRKKLIQ